MKDGDNKQNDIEFVVQNAYSSEGETDECCLRINRKMILSKLFYFFFFTAYGSLLPYMALHFKQMLLTPSEVGVLMGLKPFVSFIAVPLWGILVDRFMISRIILIISMAALVISGTGVVFVKPPADTERILREHCNKTDAKDWSPWVAQRGDIVNSTLTPPASSLTNYSSFTIRNLIPKFYRYSGYAWPLDIVLQIDTNKGEKRNFNQSSKNDSYSIDATATFVQIFILLLIGTIIGCPSLAIVDTATLKLLGKESHKYGKQRLNGSLGWGIGAFLVGASLIATHKCLLHRSYDIIDYSPCFYVYGVSMAIATVICFGLKLYGDDSEKKVENGLVDALNSSRSFSSRVHTNISQRVEIPQKASFRECFVIIKKPAYIFFLFTALLMGFEMAFIKTYLFWHLKDMGACQILFSIIAAVNCIAEVGMYFFVDKLIVFFGHKRVLCLSLACYSLRLFYYAVIPNPWWVLIVELLPGITTAAAWAACLSYVNTHNKTYYQTTMQCILHSVHWGLGYGLGEVIGGVMVHVFGAVISFIMNGFICILTLILFVVIDHVYENSELLSPLTAKSRKNSEKSNRSDISTTPTTLEVQKEANFNAEQISEFSNFADIVDQDKYIKP